MVGNDRKYFLWYAALFTCLTLVIVLFSLITVVTAPSSVASDIDCAHGENDEFSCNNGEDDNAFVIPNVSLSLNIGSAAVENQNYSPGIAYRGVSLAGGECKGELASEGVYMPVDNDAELFIRKGMNLFRIPIRWEHIAYLNGTFYANSNTRYLAKLDALIENLSNKGAAIVLDLHNDMMYNNESIVTNPSGPDGYAGTGIARLWYNLVRRYNGPDMIYSVMYAPTWGRSPSLYQAVYAAVTGIRLGELSNTQAGRYVHLLILPVINILDLNNNQLVLSYKQIPLIGRYALEALPYFDRFFSGVYLYDACIPASTYIRIFDDQWPLFVKWAIDNKQTIFISEFGIPTNTNCERILTYFLDKMHTFPYNRTLGAGIFGWSAWAGGLPGCGVENLAISLAPGYDANKLMWNDTFFYSKHLSPLVRTIPPLLPGRLAIRVLNNLLDELRFLSGYVPFQFQGSVSALPGQYTFLYSSNNYSTPDHGLQARYSIGGPKDIFIGFNPPDQLGLSVIYTNSERNCANFVTDRDCNITEKRNITESSSGPRCYFLNPRNRHCL